jgi:tetratricopeptide (TPR) repeat protein/class 3 adenylate cyclase
MGQKEKLEAAIEALESQRLALGDTAVDASIEAIRRKIAALGRGSDGRRRVVTVLAGTISGLASLEEPGLEEVPGGAGPSLREWLEQAVPERGGKVLWRGGNQFFAVWGAESPHEESPHRAIRAALDLRAKVQDSGNSCPGTLPLRVRMGVDSGPARIQAAGREREEMAVSGAAVEVAELLAARAPVDGILISENAYRHVRGVFDVVPQEPRSLEGMREPLNTYLVERAKPRAFQMPIHGVGNIETKTVGRESELKTLQNRYREAMEGSRTRVVLVAGEAGVGKSRLLYEFEKWLELLPERILFFQAQAVPETSTRPFGVFRDLLAFRFEIRDSDTPDRVRDKFRRGLANLLPADRAEVVGHWIGFDFSGSKSVTGLLGSPSFRQQAQADLFHVFRCLAAEPMVVFIEDLHWADESSLDLLERLAAEVPDKKLLFVCLARPPLFERRKNWGEAQAAFSRLDLHPLTQAQSRALVGEILQRAEAVPERLRATLVDVAQGNPFYVEELILLLMDKGVIVAGEERWRVDAEKLEGFELPGTLKGVLRARLDCLPSSERLLVQCASVVGRHFWGSAVSELAECVGELPEGAGEAGELLEVAQSRQLVFPARASSFENAREYAFKHAIVREVAYESVVQKMRRIYHAGAARWLERNLESRRSEYLSMVADHYERAGEWHKAGEYLARAGEEMVKASAFHEAVAAFERALSLLPEDRTEVTAGLLTNLGDACRVLGDHAAARRWLERALELARRAGDSRIECRALNSLARAAIIQGGYAEAKPYLAEALKLASRHGYQQEAAKVLLNLADVSFRLGDAETAMTSGQQSLRIASDLGDLQGIAGAHRVLGFATMMKGDNEAAAGHHGQGLEMFQALGDRWGVATCLINLGEVHRKMGRREEAVAYFEKSLPLAHEIDARLSIAIAHLNTAGVLSGMEGREERTLANLREALKEAKAIGAVPLILEALVYLAGLYVREGRQPQSARLLGTVVHHPSFNAEIQAYAEPVVEQIRRKLGPETLEPLMDQGRAVELESLVDEILAAPQERSSFR